MMEEQPTILKQVILLSFGNTSNFIHESTHAGHFESGDLAFSISTGRTVAQDLYDEVDAYKAQYGYDPTSVSGLNSTSSVNSFGDITNSWVQGVTNPAGKQPYNFGGSAATGLTPINIHSTQSDLMKAYPQFKSILQNIPSNYNFMSDPDVHFKTP